MKNIFKSSFLLLAALLMVTACSDDNDSNPTLQTPSTFVLNQFTMPNGSAQLDLGESTYLTFKASQPDFGYTTYTQYQLYTGLKADMSDEVAVGSPFTTPTMELSAPLIAQALTQIYYDNGETEETFPKENVTFYVRAKAAPVSMASGTLDDYAITSNTITINGAYLPFSLPPVLAPDNLYIIGDFNDYTWTSAITMPPVYSPAKDGEYWHIVYIDETGIYFNSELSNDGRVGYSNLTAIGGAHAGAITAGENNAIAAKADSAGWFLMHVQATIEGRDILYNANFEEPIVCLIGWVLAPVIESTWAWYPDSEYARFTIDGDGADALFVSPEFLVTTPGTEEAGCLRMCVLLAGHEWWHTEFIVYPGAGETAPISYRGNGGDQTRQACNQGEHAFLNFTTDQGYYAKEKK